ncbi:Mitochondrial thiamine pyrophosphate carrier 1 [Smittium culicis]|uniref:Mitochondrial thiamine pyrophosphate carrier 1 n=1 Tax=Smittium culicis TaxID=133412 RepID=A0A1R1WYJ9_9FUNG|nr:Mitochondrial thiamine pyrophosphate carrier 1 [Smittium culicis]OMJ07494.1 Mitochondrial thiamine pyrophosphate carrier 1 [Smittium culicis]OMJ22228.1 Mitochondrial thiamine pyrophosphate carrier 1 [Smittium culicis]
MATSDNNTAVLDRLDSTKHRPLSSTEQLLCGSFTGLFSRLTVAPIDVLKISLQLDSSKRSLFNHKPSQSIIIKKISNLYLKEGFKNLSSELNSLLCGSVAGLSATITSYPFDLLRTRFAAQSLNNKAYSSYSHAINHILKYEGISGFYKGLSSASIQIIPYIGLVFGTYDFISKKLSTSKSLFINDLISNNPSSTNAVVGAVAGVISKTIVYPLDLVRKRMQIQGPNLYIFAPGIAPKPTIYSTTYTIIKSEGPLCLFRGLLPSLIKAAPSSASAFFSYSIAKNFILAHF